MLDIFKNNAFSVVQLTDAINELKFVPGRIGQLGLFTETPVSTTTIAIEKKGDQLILVPPTARGGPGTTTDKLKRTLRPFIVPHFEINDAVMAEEVQGVRAMGTEQAVETLQGMLAGRFFEHQRSFSATEEYARVGAIKGIVTYADGSTLDLFAEFGIDAPAEIAFDLSNVATDGRFRKKCASVVRTVAAALDGLPYNGVLAQCSDSFYDDLIGNAEVRATFLNQEEGRELRTGYADPRLEGGNIFGRFQFGGITWENYRGAIGGTPFIAADKCHIVPLGVPGLFRTYYAPADYIDTVNTPGQRLYAKQYEMPNGKGIHLDVQSNALQICTRPNVLLKGKRGA